MGRIRLLPEPAGANLVELAEPPNWDEVFGFSGPLELEIGAGTGGFALGYAERFPTRRLIAIEWRKKYARDVDNRAEKRGLKNLRVLEADARMVVPRLFAPGSLAAVHLQFPDPWWKRSHQKRAVIQPDFAKLLMEKMAPGALFDLRTDVQDRADSMLSVLEEVGFINPLGKGAYHPYDPEDVPSTRERRYLIRQEPVYRGRLRRP
jgi:tRNA (guanine-N7-)-methyltransferase